jgi:hypothetical protein
LKGGRNSGQYSNQEVKEMTKRITKKVTKKAVQKKIYITINVNGVPFNIDVTEDVEYLLSNMIGDIFCDNDFKGLYKAVEAGVEKELGNTNSILVTHLTKKALESLKK